MRCILSNLGASTTRLPPQKRAPNGALFCGGEGGIRTHGKREPTPVFKTGALNHSATSPSVVIKPIVGGMVKTCRFFLRRRFWFRLPLAGSTALRCAPGQDRCLKPRGHLSVGGHKADCGGYGQEPPSPLIPWLDHGTQRACVRTRTRLVILGLDPRTQPHACLSVIKSQKRPQTRSYWVPRSSRGMSGEHGGLTESAPPSPRGQPRPPPPSPHGISMGSMAPPPGTTPALSPPPQPMPY